MLMIEKTARSDYLLSIRVDMAHLGDVVFDTGFEGRPLPVKAAPAPKPDPGGGRTG